MAHGAAERHGAHLVAVAEAQHGDAQLVDAGVHLRRVGRVDGRGTAREDERGRGHGGELVSRDVAGDDLGVHLEVAHAARDQLPVLGAEVENCDELLWPGATAFLSLFTRLTSALPIICTPLAKAGGSAAAQDEGAIPWPTEETTGA